MTQMTVMTEEELGKFVEYIRDVPMPFTVTVKGGKARSLSQNALIHKWFGEIARQTIDDPEEVKCQCKAWHGIPILRAEDPEFAAFYEASIMQIPDAGKRMKALRYVPVTSIMTTEQLSRFADAVYREYTSRGIDLTMPEGE